MNQHTHQQEQNNSVISSSNPVQLHDAVPSHVQNQRSANILDDMPSNNVDNADNNCGPSNIHRRNDNNNNNQRSQRVINNASVSMKNVRYNRRNNPELEKRRIHHCEFLGELKNLIFRLL